MHIAAIIIFFIGAVLLFLFFQQWTKLTLELGKLRQERLSTQSLREADHRIYGTNLEKFGYEAEFVSRRAADMLQNMQRMSSALQYDLRYIDRVRKWFVANEAELKEKGITFPAAVDSPDTTIFDYHALIPHDDLDRLLSSTGELWRELDEAVRKNFPGYYYGKGDTPIIETPTDS